MNSLITIVNEDERLDSVELDTSQSEILTESVSPVLATPAAVTVGVTAAISGIF